MASADDHPNSNLPSPSPSLLRELSEAIKKLHATTHILVTPFVNNLSPLPFPASETIPFDQNRFSNSNPTSSTTSSLNEKLEQLKVAALSLKQKQETDRQRLSELMDSKKAFGVEIMENLDEVFKDRRNIGLRTHEITGNQITSLTRFNEMTVEIIELTEVLTNSRLASLHEIVKNLSLIREDLQDNEVWNELNEGLMKVQEMEVKDFDMLAKETNLQLAYFEQRIHNLYKISENSR